MHPVIFSTDLFGILSKPFSLHTYGLMIATGFLLTMVLSSRQAAREDEDPDRIVDLAFYVLLAGLLGARTVFVITKFDEFMQNPIEIFMFWRGGLVWYGSFIGGVTFGAWYTRRYRLNFFKIADIGMPFVALAHAFGRFGCVAAGCCFGKPTELPWGISFPQGSMAQTQQQVEGLVGLTERSLAVHPTQLYEAGLEMGLFWLLIMLRPHKKFHGQIFLIWLAAYSIGRSIIEVFRGDKERGIYWIMSTSQWISVGVAIAAVVLTIHLLKKHRAQTTA